MIGYVEVLADQDHDVNVVGRLRADLGQHLLQQREEVLNQRVERFACLVQFELVHLK